MTTAKTYGIDDKVLSYYRDSSFQDIQSHNFLLSVVAHKDHSLRVLFPRHTFLFYILYWLTLLQVSRIHATFSMPSKLHIPLFLSLDPLSKSVVFRENQEYLHLKLLVHLLYQMLFLSCALQILIDTLLHRNFQSYLLVFDSLEHQIL